MHILLIHQFFLEDHAGGGMRWNDMSKFWTEQGHQVTVLAGSAHYMQARTRTGSNRVPRFTDVRNAGGTRVIRCRVPDGYHANFTGRFLAYISFMLSAVFAGVFYARDKYDVVLVTSPPLFAGFSAWILACLKRLPLVLEVRDLWPESAIDTGVLTNSFIIRAAYRSEQFLYKRTRLIYVLTPAFAEVLVKLKQVPAGKLAVIPNGADFEAVEQVAAGFDVAQFRLENDLESYFVIVYVGAHGLANHLVQILNTAELMCEMPVLFLLIGDGMQKKDLQEETLRRQLSNVRFLDMLPKNEVLKYILAADAGMSVLKKADAFKTIYSNKTFDYFACKKPVFMLIDGLSRKLVEDADAGIFVEPEVPADFARKIAQYVGDSRRCERQGANGYRYAKQHFDRKVLAEAYLESLTKCL